MHLQNLDICARSASERLSQLSAITSSGIPDISDVNRLVPTAAFSPAAVVSDIFHTIS